MQIAAFLFYGLRCNDDVALVLAMRMCVEVLQMQRLLYVCGVAMSLDLAALKCRSLNRGVSQ